MPSGLLFIARVTIISPDLSDRVKAELPRSSVGFFTHSPIHPFIPSLFHFPSFSPVFRLPLACSFRLNSVHRKITPSEQIAKSSRPFPVLLALGTVRLDHSARLGGV